MPCYDYKCHECKHSSVEYMKMSSAAEAPAVPCALCGSPMHREVSLVHTDLKEFSTPIEMFSIAMEDKDEIRAFKLACPDVDCSDDERHPDYGLPIARSRKAKLQALQAAKFVESN